MQNAPITTLARAEIELLADPTAGFYLQQNDVPLIKRLTVKNTGSAPLSDLEVRVTTDPSFARPWTAHITAIAPGQQRVLDGMDILLSPEYLVSVTETVRGHLHVTVSQREAEVASLSQPVELLAYDHWSGLRAPAELLAAFVLPNHPVVEAILSAAADKLRASSAPDTFDGYQRQSRNAALGMVQAIYETLRDAQLSYAMPPASFEEEGQKVRTPDRVMQNRLATCLDLSLLLAACFEQAGLHALVLLLDGHALPAVWLEEKSLAVATTEDPIDLRKRIDASEMVAVESTLLTGAQSQPFDKALRRGREHLEDAESLRCAIDIARARRGRVRPIQVRVSSDGGYEPEISQPDAHSPGGPLPQLAEVREPAVNDDAPADAVTTRLDKWRRKLLDLTLNNRLLNFKPTKKTLPILCPDLTRLEDLLADGVQFHLTSRPSDMSGSDPRDGEAHLRRTGDDAVQELLREGLEKKRIYVDLPEDQLARRALEMYREARLSQEESGTSALYCAFGFLTWYKQSSSDKAQRAPLLLIPVNLVRGSIGHGFKLEISDDEPRVNMSLVELLEQDFELSIRELDPLPMDGHGVDVGRVFDVFRSAVAGIERWEVRPDVAIGFFSFRKFLMWRDLQEHEAELLKNPVVHHLVEKRHEAFDDGAPIPAPESLDRESRPAQIFCPLSFDSSQLSAVLAAAQGSSFVLEGPPGTGKSQTITNMIAQCIATNKTVLFVAEKSVALKVVHDRLEAVGLGDYCLELHSNKAKKAEVIRQVARALARDQPHNPKAWPTHSGQVERIQQELNAYVHALHTPREAGHSVFRGMSHLIGSPQVPLIRVSWEQAPGLNQRVEVEVEVEAEIEMDNAAGAPDTIARLRTLARDVATMGAAVGNVETHPWRMVERDAWSPLWANRVGELLSQLQHALENVARHASDVLGLLGVPLSGISFERLAAVSAASAILVDPPYVPKQIIVASDWAQVQEQLANLLTSGRRRDELRGSVMRTFSSAVLTFELGPVRERLQQAATAWGPLRWLRRFFTRRTLRPALLPGAKLPLEQLEPSIERAIELQAEERIVAALDAPMSGLLGALWRAGNPLWEEVEAVAAWAQRCRSAALRVADGDVQAAARLRARWAELLSEAPDALMSEGLHGSKLVSFQHAMTALQSTIADLEAELGSPKDSLVRHFDGPEPLGYALGWVQKQAGTLPRLRDFCRWVEARNAAYSQGMGPIVEAYTSRQITGDQIADVAEKSYFQWWVETTVSDDDVLRRFHAGEHKRRIHEFRKALTDHQALVTEAIRARLSARTPATDSKRKSPGMGVLLKETQKKRRHMPVRALIGEAGDVITQLTPCFLMSPISVAQYLDPRLPSFDVVIFDEASQIPSWDAVGAIARGQAAVVVGDPKQLPPTNFFTREGSDDDLETADDIEDLESILDECMSAQLPHQRLRWHYRSRHESLIAFSNWHYYDNKLLTLPSADTEEATDRGVRFRYIADGQYDKGKTRTNKREAEVLVEEIVERLRKPDASGSIGVVTLNIQQRTLIEELLDEQRRQHPEIEPFFAEDAQESVFVKNLENVQGDEREVIMFSVGYGPDAAGKVGMNFGPMNRDGGQRRLNVAITRARTEVLVFSSLRADQIDLSKTRAIGVRDLRAFLDYAERGPKALAEATAIGPDADFGSPFEQEVCDRLRKLGWEVIPQVGCSGYRIDLGIVDPDARGRFLMGVECDGASYHSAATARDRDKLRESVLEGLGWKLHRIWSTDWWHDPEGQTQALHAALQADLERARAERSSQ